MAVAFFDKVRICGIKSIVPEKCISIDDELQYFDNNPKKLARAKKMIGYGERYIADENTTVTDMAVDVSQKLLKEMEIPAEELDLLIVVNQNPDYPRPSDACVIHGRLKLKKGCTALSINLGCSGYVYALMTAAGLMSSGAFNNCLVIAGDNPAHDINVKNRKIAPVFGDAVSATVLKFDESSPRMFFITGTDGEKWNRIVHPFGGQRLPYQKEDFDIAIYDDNGNLWTPEQGLMKGEDIFSFTMDVAPRLIEECLLAASWNVDDVDLFAIHQANKQIVEMIAIKAEIPNSKVPVETFSKYANNSVSSVAMVLCDQLKDNMKKAVLCSFGIGLSWGGAALDLSGIYNGGIVKYTSSYKNKSRQEQITHWINYFKGVENE